MRLGLGVDSGVMFRDKIIGKVRFGFPSNTPNKRCAVRVGMLGVYLR